jgi:cell division GTPase FtsZ
VLVKVISSGGGGGNILHRVRAMSDQRIDGLASVNTDYCAFLREMVRYGQIDTNRFAKRKSIADEEWLLLKGPGEMGSGHNPDVALAALETSMSDFERFIGPADVVPIVVTCGKGTGTGTIVRMCQVIRDRRKLPLPFIVEPALDAHEVDPVQHQAALGVMAEMDRNCIRFAHLRNDSLYGMDLSSQEAYDLMNITIANAIHALLLILSDLNQVDPSDLARIFAGPGRFRVSFAEFDTSGNPTEEAIAQAAKSCFANQFYGFEDRTAKSTLVCINGPHSHKTKGRITSALNHAATAIKHLDYKPHLIVVPDGPQPWGVITVQTDNDGSAPPLNLAFDSVEGPIMISRTEQGATPVLSTVTLPAQTPGQEDNGTDIVVRIPEPSTDTVTASAQTPPEPTRVNGRRHHRRRASRHPPSREGGSSTHHPRKGVSTGPSPKTVNGKGAKAPQPPPVPPPPLQRVYPTFTAFLQDLNQRKEPAVTLIASERGLEQIGATGEELRSFITGPLLFRATFDRMSAQMKEGILLIICGSDEPRIRNWDVHLTTKASVPLRQMTKSLWAEANATNLTEGDKSRRADCLLIRRLVELYGDSVLDRLPFEPEKVKQPGRVRVLYAKATSHLPSFRLPNIRWGSKTETPASVTTDAQTSTVGS